MSFARANVGQSIQSGLGRMADVLLGVQQLVEGRKRQKFLDAQNKEQIDYARSRDRTMDGFRRDDIGLRRDQLSESMYQFDTRMDQNAEQFEAERGLDMFRDGISAGPDGFSYDPAADTRVQSAAARVPGTGHVPLGPEAVARIGSYDRANTGSTDSGDPRRRDVMREIGDRIGGYTNPSNVRQRPLDVDAATQRAREELGPVYGDAFPDLFPAPPSGVGTGLPTQEPEPQGNYLKRLFGKIF